MYFICYRLDLWNKKLAKSLKEDMSTWAENRAFEGFLLKRLNNFMLEEKDKNLLKSAEMSVEIIHNLLLEKVPSVFLRHYLSILLKNKKVIRNNINFKKANDVYDLVPIDLMISFLDLYEMNLT